MQGFRSRRFDILVATDIAARGIDVSDISHVINFEVPNTPEAYTHRIGRTGRSERAGIACTFVTSEDRGWVRATERMIGSPIPRRQVEGFEANADEETETLRSARGNGRGARPSGQQRNGRRGSGNHGRSRRRTG